MIKHRFVVIGAGAWGTALALHLAKNHHQVALWGQNTAHLLQIAQDRKNLKYLGDFKFPANLEVAIDLKQALTQTHAIIVIAVPSAGFDATLRLIQPFLIQPKGLVSATKGLSEQGQFLHTLASAILPTVPFALLSGPSFALEVAKGLPTAVTLAASDIYFRDLVALAFHNNTFRVYQSEDILGVALGGCIKNVLAVAVGIADGMGLGANARAALITRGLAELMRLGLNLGAQTQTLMGLSGVGDLVLTCTDNQSRNRRFGVCLGQGKSIDEALKEVMRAVEGYPNAKQVYQLAAKQHVAMPIVEEVYQVLFENKSPQDALLDLMGRSPKNETM